MAIAQWISKVRGSKIENAWKSCQSSARILTYVKDLQTGRDRQILVSSADGLADIKPNAENGAFTGDLKLRKLNLSLHRRYK